MFEIMIGVAFVQSRLYDNNRPVRFALQDFAQVFNNGVLSVIHGFYYHDHQVRLFLKGGDIRLGIVMGFAQAAGIEKGSDAPNKNKVATVTRDQVREIAETKMPDLNANDVEAGMRIIAGTARSMGITVEV